MFFGLAYMPNDVADLKKGVDNSASDGSREGVITLVVGSLEKNLDVRTQRSLEDRRGLISKSFALLQEGAGGSEVTMAIISVPLSDGRSKGTTAGVVRDH